jgi:transposase
VQEAAARLGVSSHSLYKWVKAARPEKNEQRGDELLDAKKENLKHQVDWTPLDSRAEARRIHMSEEARETPGVHNPSAEFESTGPMICSAV